MLERLYADNYRCLERFELGLRPRQLFIGANGVGKSSVLDLLAALRGLSIAGARCDDMFPWSSRSVWRDEDPQEFRLSANLDGEPLEHHLIIGWERRKILSRSIIAQQTVTISGMEVYRQNGPSIEVRNDSGKVSESFSFDSTLSPLGSLALSPRHDRLRRFIGWLDRLVVVRPVPITVSSEASGEADRPSRTVDNLASWLRYLMQQDPGSFGDFFDRLREAMPGFDRLKLTGPAGDRRGLAAVIRDQRRETEGELRIDQLSDGQRMLVILYAASQWLLRPGSLLCLDEPDNFIALPEIQGWLLHTLERAEDLGAQLILVSHHPELLNQLATEDGVVFCRPGGGHVVAKPFSAPDETILTPAELVARRQVGD